LTLRAFQHALSELVASPKACLAVRTGGDEFFRRFELSDTEKTRLMKIVWQQGMSVSCSIYRSNRITPLYTMLHFSCLLLGTHLKREVDEYWESSAAPDMQFKSEVERFGQFLKRRLALGAIANPYLDEILDFELALNALQFLPRRRILRQIQDRTNHDHSGALQLSPLIRVVRFRHEPLNLLDLLGQEQTPPQELPTGEFFIVLDAAAEQIELKQIDCDLGSALFRIQADGECQQGFDEVMALRQAGLLVPLHCCS
jgi:hypothetical protein